MNVGNILKVADAIDGRVVPDLGFNLQLPFRTGGQDYSGHSCGTVACIAGWASLVEGRHIDDATSWRKEVMPWAQTYFGLDEAAANELMAPMSIILTRRFPMPSDKDAVRCLRNLAITGKVDWEAAMKPADPVMPALPAPVASKVRA